MRLFFAVELPLQVRGILGRLRTLAEDGDYRWVDPSRMHVTLAFLGEQPEARLAALQRIGQQAAGASSSAQLRLGSAGFFGSRRSPRVLWVDLAGEIEALLELQNKLQAGLREGGFPTEDRAFRAHITLARRREAAQGGAPPGWPPEVEHASFKVERLTLMQSRLSSRGPTYIAVSEFPLAS